MADFRYAPDVPPDTPNVWTVCDGFHADVHGKYRTGWLAGSAVASPATIGGALGYQSIFAYETAEGTPQVVAAAVFTSGPLQSLIKVYNRGGLGTWSARTGTAGFCTFFAQMGNYTLACGVDASTGGVHYRDATGTSDFASALSATQICAVAVTARNIAVAVGAGAAWYTSDIASPTNWSTGEAASGDLWQTQGPVKAVIPFGDDALVFKWRSIYRGRYVGNQVKWAWSVIDSEKGAWGPWSACAGDNKAFFIGPGGCFQYDGSYFKRIDYGIWRTLLSSLAVFDTNGGSEDETRLFWDAQSRRLFIFKLGNINSGTAAGTRYTTANAFFTYEPDSEKWGYQSLLTNAGTEAFTGVCDGSSFNTYATSGTAGPKYNTNMLLFSATNDAFKYVTDTFTAGALTSYQPKVRTSRVGIRRGMTTTKRFIPAWTLSEGIGSDLSTATLKTMTPYGSDSLMEAEVAGTPQTLSTDLYRGDCLVQRRFLSAEVKINCEAVLDGGEFVSRTVVDGE